MSGWEDLASFLAALTREERDRFSRHAALGLPEDEEGISRTLEGHAEENPDTTPALLLATTGAQAGFARDFELAPKVGSAALELARTDEERQVAHVSLAQTHFQNRRDEAELARFEDHCRAAIELGHAGTFCYERLAALHEYRGEIRAAAGICRRAIEVLDEAGDSRSAEKFEKRLQRLEKK